MENAWKASRYIPNQRFVTVKSRNGVRARKRELRSSLKGTEPRRARRLERPLSIRQEKDMSGVVLGIPKGYSATEAAPFGKF